MASHQPTSGTSKVIENLQTTIDSLKTELNETKATLSETKQKYSILSKRNESMVEQLSNTKHQAEVAESLLKRKERRVLDLEAQITEVASSSDSYRFQCETLKNKLQNFESDKSRLLAENERLSKSYDILQSSFNDYKLSMSHSVDNLKFQIPNFIDSTKTKLAENLASLKTSQPQIDSSYNIMLKNSKRLEELYSQKYDKVNNYLLLLAESTKQHGESTSIIMEECEEILKKLNRNEDVLLKIKNETTGHLTDLDKMKEFNKRRDFSILNDSSNIYNSPSAAAPAPAASAISSPSLNSPSASASPSLSAISSVKGKNSLSSPLSKGNSKFPEKRRISPGILDSKFNLQTGKTRSSSPEVNENEFPRERSGNNANSNRHRKRNSINSVPKKDNRRKSSYRHSMNFEDDADQQDDQSYIERRKRVISGSTSSPPSPSSGSALSRSNSTRRNNKNNSRVSSTSSNSGNGSNNHRRSLQPHDNNADKKKNTAALPL